MSSPFDTLQHQIDEHGIDAALEGLADFAVARTY